MLPVNCFSDWTKNMIAMCNFFFFLDWLKFKKKIFSKTRRHNVGMMIWEVQYKIPIFCADNMTAICSSFLGLAIKTSSLKPNPLTFGRKHLWKVLYNVSSKQSDRWATPDQRTESLVIIIIIIIIIAIVIIIIIIIIKGDRTRTVKRKHFAKYYIWINRWNGWRQIRWNV